LVAARNDCVPPKQKPTVLAPAAPVRSFSAASAAAASCCTVRGRVCRTCGMYSKSSPRGPSPAVRPK
jgi:hypothetical protein